MIIMGVDFGDARTGIAVCDKYEMMARDEPMIKADGFKTTAELVAARAKELAAELSSRFREWNSPMPTSRADGKVVPMPDEL